MTGKVLGQFFTQPLVKNMMVKLIDPQIYLNGRIDTCGDPAMGTGGFLITYLKYILEQAKIKKITPDWSFIKTEGLYGKELEPDTYQLAVSNMLISSGHMFENLEIRKVSNGFILVVVTEEDTHEFVYDTERKLLRAVKSYLGERVTDAG